MTQERSTMTATATKPRTTRRSTKAPATPATPAKPTEALADEAPKAPRVPAVPAYRDRENFTPALKAAKAAAKGNAELIAPLQLITHLAWRSPAAKVGWAKGTTQQVVDYADDLLLPSGTPIQEAMDAALSAADKATTDKPQKDALAVLSKVIRS